MTTSSREDGPEAAESEARAARLFARPWAFERGARAIADLPPAGRVEVAFAGRSNVGKSSLINALTGQKALARTSKDPGRTRELNFFVPEGADAPALAIVDMPGYGYAKAPKEAVAEWTRLIHAYLRGRPSLRRAFVLVDARHGLKPNDETVLNELDTAAVAYQIVLTKADKVKPGALATVVEATAKAIARRPAAHPDILVTSSQAGHGVEVLRAEIAALSGD
ncbi:MAG TPA: ribosome biogenesis GTP-binding protein YihA/YsxC [Afifellaceae bacterium]|nr:ribosome biogenesis GTP-binding protein YihA/YsxC [Afifellaceae bacterium]